MQHTTKIILSYITYESNLNKPLVLLKCSIIFLSTPLLLSLI